MGSVTGSQRVQREEGEAKKVLKALAVGAHEASGSQPQIYICHRAEVGQNYLHFSYPMGVFSAGFG